MFVSGGKAWMAFVQRVKENDWSDALGPSNVADAVGAPMYCEKSSELSWARASWVKTARKRASGRI
jgi:hypothetical protein